MNLYLVFLFIFLTQKLLLEIEIELVNKILHTSEHHELLVKFD